MTEKEQDALKNVRKRNEEVEALQEKLLLPSEPLNFQDAIGTCIKEAEEIILELEKDNAEDIELRDTFLTKTTSNTLAVKDYITVWHTKLNYMKTCLERKRTELSKVEDELQDLENSNDADVDEEMSRICVLAIAGDYGKTPKELWNLKKVLIWSEKRKFNLDRELQLAQEESKFGNAWAEWARRRACSEGVHNEIRMVTNEAIIADQEPQRSDFAKTI